MNAQKVRLVLLGLGVALSFYWVLKSCKGSESKEPVSQGKEPVAKVRPAPVLKYYQFKHLRVSDLQHMNKLLDGVNLSFMSSGVMISGPSNAVESVIENIETADVSRRQIDVDVKIIDVTQTVSNESAVKWLVDTLGAAPNRLSVEYDKGLNVGFVGGDISAAYDVLRESGKVSINANPVLSCTEGETAKISFGEKRPVVTDTQTTDVGTQRSTYEYKSIGVGVEVTPFCGVSNSVQMMIRQASEDVTGTTTIDGNEVPIIASREFSSSLRVEHGRALVIGGMKKTNNEEVETSFPLLGSVPLLGHLFRSHSTVKREIELCVILRPSVR